MFDYSLQYRDPRNNRWVVFNNHNTPEGASRDVVNLISSYYKSEWDAIRIVKGRDGIELEVLYYQENKE